MSNHCDEDYRFQMEKGSGRQAKESPVKKVFEIRVPPLFESDNSFGRYKNCDVAIEDGGSAIILTVYDSEFTTSEEENGMFVRIQSWDERKDPSVKHEEIRQFANKKIRITIETIEE